MLLRACFALPRHAVCTATQLARTCRRLYYGTPWRAWLTTLDDACTAKLTPETMAPWVPHLKRFVYRMPCHHGSPDVVEIVRSCVNLEHLAVIGNECYSLDIYAGSLPASLTSLYLGRNISCDYFRLPSIEWWRSDAENDAARQGVPSLRVIQVECDARRTTKIQRDYRLASIDVLRASWAPRDTIVVSAPVNDAYYARDDDDDDEEDSDASE